ncbi:4-hydroxythreonine-4-phosphate dehydrogenase [Desulfobaculum xiamenense]|uniref:4-hydroxythreonine-4-phosphate dehydrogenase n=1 Tax=Desulfobaculum xiamenense TaxID=995050 RepID=A0A846QJ61_9BACT|nr:4-hydroxythreonine-4-phosphate dehydrogenase PdxA [Desulfobaculum xiamenense]NJB67097.1 4-hydroxythreonine-4-phosphate dehydrogenase [Desulfobaculum xiamenense]
MTEQTLLLTLGDPNGLGPELVCRLLGSGELPSSRLVLIGPETALAHHARRLGIAPFWTRVSDPGECPDKPVVLVVPEGLEDFVMQPGQPHPEGGRAAGLTLEAACGFLLAGKAHGVVTCPLNKAMLQDAGFDFPGHTEFFAERLGVGRDNVCMHLGGPRLRVSLVTTHPRLADVPALITRERVLRCLRLTRELVRALGVDDAPIAVCGLNPHAGESGKIGREEIEIIGPAVDEARAEGIDVAGPLPGDTVFHFAAQGRYSAVLAMYHDQGLAPLKLLHFYEAVNVTLGLPVVRTSVDHGTGYDITGHDVADLGSLRAAIDWAERLVRGRFGAEKSRS